MKELNDTNGASKLTAKVTAQCLEEFSTDLIGAEFGVAYGGGIERIGKLWKDRGIVYGFDTFEGHPKEVANDCKASKEAGGLNSFAALCMDEWYRSPEYGTEAIKLKHIQGELTRQGIDNVKLIKGIVTKKTSIDFIHYLNYCLIDFDFPVAQLNAYNLVKGKIVKGGYLCLHDMIPKGHIHGNYEVYIQILNEGLFEIVSEHEPEYLVILKKI